MPGFGADRRGAIRGGRGAGVCALLVAFALLLGCGEGPPRPPRVLVVGIDGATFRVIGPLFEQGRLPVLRGLAEAGAFGSLRAFVPLFSPRIWNTMATGKTPERHGIVSFVRDDAAGRRLYLSSDRAVPALWNMLTQRGVTVSVVNWWNTFPPERIAGVMVSDHFFPGQLADRERVMDASAPGGVGIQPAEWGPRAVALLADESWLTQAPDPFAAGRPLPRWVDRAVLAKFPRFDAKVARVALAIEAELEPQVLMVLFTGIDRVSHYLWGVMEPAKRYPPKLRPTPAARAGGRAALEAYYEYTDALLGLLLERYDENDLVLVVSDHGFEAATFEHVPRVRALRPTGGHESEAARDGVVFARGRGVVPGAIRGMTVNDVTPTLLAWLGLPVGADMDGRPAPFLGDAPFATIPSWDDTPVERPSTARGAEDEILKQLRELGYLAE